MFGSPSNSRATVVPIRIIEVPAEMTDCQFEGHIASLKKVEHMHLHLARTCGKPRKASGTLAEHIRSTVREVLQ